MELHTVMMKCGHSANAFNEKKEPCCAICVGTTPNAEIVDDNPPDLTGRKARCHYSQPKRGYTCRGIVDSSPDLPFFKREPDKPYDSYYCGCWGWD